jgi:hypothetical protein
VHAGEEATAAARRMGARAFTQGADVYVDRDELAAPGAARLLAHEATHAVRHDPQLVHAKMRGVKDALVSQGGGRSTKGIRRFVPGTKTNWDKIVDSVAAYEKLETDLLAKHPSPQMLGATRPKMVRALQTIEAAVAKWRQANNEAGAQAWAEAVHQEDHEVLLIKEDRRWKAPRRQAINMLLPRVRTELADVAAGQWGRTLGLSDDQLVATGETMSGQMNTVTELTYESEDGDFRGYFKADKGFDPMPEEHSLNVGIRQADPNYAARSVAMYRLDQLLDAGVTARAEFAVHNGQMGLALESARGTRAMDANLVFSRAAAQAAGPGAFSVDDAVLQRCLNKLQILDAIAGQLDRHGGNYFIHGEGGQVSGVTGIDLDMAFGQDMTSFDDHSARKAHNYKRALPDEIDEAFGQKVLTVQDNDLRAVLRGLLSDREVEATVQRLQSVQAVIRQKAATNQLRSSWDDPAVAASQRLASAEAVYFGGNRPSYGADVQVPAMDRIDDRVGGLVAVEVPRRLAAELPAVTVETIVKALLANKTLTKVVRTAIYEGGVPPEKEEELTLRLIDQLLDDDTARAKIELTCQEDPAPRGAVGEILDEVVNATKADIIASFRR